MRTFKIYSLSNFQIGNTVLLTLITMLYREFFDSKAKAEYLSC